MLFRWLAIIFSCTTLLLAAALVWMVGRQFLHASAQQPSNNNIAFPDREFENTEAYVFVVGTLTGDWIAYKNNTYSILCLPGYCLVAYVEQIGPSQIGRIYGPTTYPVTKWTDDEIIASDNDLCRRATWTIDRGVKMALYAETPINQTADACAGSDSNIRKATIEPSPFWRKP
jgi:hypothetical protein